MSLSKKTFSFTFGSEEHDAEKKIHNSKPVNEHVCSQAMTPCLL